VGAAVIDCLLWAAAALYWPLLQSSPDAEILGHRLVWAALFMACILAATGHVGTLRALVRHRRKVLYLVGAAVAITVNWAGFIWGVNHGHVVEASLGFFINPLMTVLLGVVVLGERVRPGQWVAIGLAALAVLVVSVDYGHLPWYALMLAFSGGFYGLFKKKADTGPYESLALETAVVAPAALVYLLLSASRGRSTFATQGIDHALLLVGGGLVTVTPLLFYGYAVTRVPLVTLGLVGYLAPAATFVLGIAYFRETLGPARLVGFVLVWVALAVVAVETVRTRGRAPVPVGVV
jgi:chloramphenicol-sensitive protein RarD